MRTLLLGNTGQLGWELERCLGTLGELYATDYPEVDLADPSRVQQLFQRYRPQVIVNATAYTAVDRAESEPELAMAINGSGPGLLAEEARRLGSALIHFSTDYVFDGKKGLPYLEDDTPNPLSVYGKSKLAGESAVQDVGGSWLVLRTSWVYSLRRDSFVTKVLSWSRQHTQLKLVTDQVSNPTWCRALAEVTAQTLATGGKHIVPWLAERSGLYHLAGWGYTSRMEWGQAILRYDPHKSEQIVENLLPAVTSDYPAPAERPLFSALNCERFTSTFALRLPDWEYSLRLAMQN